MNIGKIVNPCLCALVTISGIGLRVFAAKDICDTTILNHPACEVGDFDLRPMNYPKTQIIVPVGEPTCPAFVLANRCLKAKNYDKAIAILKSAIAADSSDRWCSYFLSEAYVQYGDDLRQRDELKRAFEQYQLALKVFPPSAEAKKRLKELDVSPVSPSHP